MRVGKQNGNNTSRKSAISQWKPKNQSEILVVSDGKIFQILFDKIFDVENIGNLNKFYIKKGSYETQLDIISKYINFFMVEYDQENEMATAYLKIKYALDKEKLFDESNPDQLIDLIYEILFTDSIIEKINRLTEDNYLDDIESKKYVGKEKKHLESLEFTNQHIKILLRISFGMKVIAPILFHYVSTNVIKLDKDGDLIFRFYRKLFDIFSDGVNIYNKLFVYVKAKVLESKSLNGLIFDQRDISGTDEYTVIHQFLNKVLISENMVKYKFSEKFDAKTGKYKENIVGFEQSSTKTTLIAGNSR